MELMQTNLALVVILCIAALVAPAAAQPQEPDWFVDADVAMSGDGDTWPEAFKTLEEALDDAQDQDIIWVAEGDYVPTLETDPGDPRSRTFLFTDDKRLQLYGGFLGNDHPQGGETLLSQRNPEENITILEGELFGGTSGATRVYHVVTVEEDVPPTTLISGFTIRLGLADGADGGGGMIINQASPSVARCTFRLNDSFPPGGAVRIFHGTGLGEGVPVFLTCSFLDNESATNGGAIWDLFGAQDGRATFINCAFARNQARRGGAVGAGSDSNLTVVNCTFADNAAVDPTGNALGGGIFFDVEPNPITTIENCIFWGNVDDGGSDESAQLSDISGEVQEGLTVSHSCIQGLSFYSGSGNIGDNPLFVDATSGDYRLLSSSPCIDAGDTAAIEAHPDFADVDDDGDTDEPTPGLDLNDRVRGDEVDMGAYECSCPEDLDGDDSVGFADLLAVLDAWGPCPGCPEDLDGSGDVGFADLLAILNAWGPCPCPGGTPGNDECADRDLGANCECRDTLTDLIENGTQAESENARCWLDHYITCHDAQGCNGPAECPDDDPCGNH